MQNVAVVDCKERFCSISIFSEGWKASNLKGTVIIKGNFLERESGTAEKVRDEIRRITPDECAVILLLPRSLAQVTSLEIPAQNADTLKKMMDFEVTRHFPLSLDQLSYDFFITGSDEGRFQTNLAGLKRSDFDAWYDAAISAGIYPNAVSISSAAWLPPAQEFPVPEKRTFIEIMPEGFEMSLVNGRRLMYSRFKRFPQEIGERPFFEFITQTDVSASLIADRISAELDHIRLVSGIDDLGKYLETVYIAGGGYLRGSIAGKLSANPAFLSSSIQKLPSNDGESGFDYVARATGMAGLDSKDVRFNFIPAHMRRPSFGAARRRLAAAGVTIFSLLLIWGLTAWGVQWNRIRGLKNELADLKSKVSKTEKVLIKAEEMQAYFNSFAEFRQRPSFNLSMLDSLTTALPKNTYLAEIETRGKEVIISGTSREASPLLNILENSQSFKNVRMIGAVKTVRGMERFKIGMELE